MKMKRITLLLVLPVVVLTISKSNAQTPGYLGKKNLVSIFTTPSFRLLPAFGPFGEGGSGYDTYVAINNGNSISNSTKVGRIDLRIGYTRVIDRQKQLGAEFGYEHIILPSNRYYSDNKMSSPQLNQYGGYIKFGLTSGKFIAPVGLTTTFGIGPQFYKFDRSDPYFLYASGYGNVSDTLTAFPDYTSSMWSLNLFYQVSYRIILAKSLSLELGLRLRTGFVFMGSNISTDYNFNAQSIYNFGYDPTIDRPLYTKDDLRNMLRNEVTLNLVQFRFGLNFML